MVLKTLVDAILQSQREPYNLLHVQLIQTLKKDISYDVTEAFTASQPLIDLYPELYRNSSSFLDFLFKLCHAPAPPLPSCQGKGEAMSFLSEDMRNFQKRLDVKEKEIESLQEELANKRTYYETEMRKLERKLAHAEKELKDYVSQKEYESEIHANLTADTVSTTPAGLFNHSNAYNITSQSPRCSDTLTPAITADSCSALNALEYPRSDECVFQKLKDWKQELWTFLNNFKTEMARDFTLTQERNQNIEQLLETLRPTQTPALPEIPVKPTVSVDDISEALFDKFEQVLTRRLSEEQLRSMLKTFKLDEHFDELIGKVKCILSNGSQSPKKVLSQIHETKVTVTQITKSLLQKISTLFGSQLPSLELMQHLDRLENELLVKNTQLAKTLEPSKVQHYCQTHLPTVGYSEDWEKRLIDHMEALTAFRQTFYDQLQIIHARFNLSYVPDGRPEEILMRLCDTTLQQSQDLERQLKDTTDQLHSIHQEMLEKMNLDPKSQTVMLRNSKHLETGFFEWLEGNVNMLKEKLETAYAQLEANEVPSQCVISEVPNLPSLCAPVVEEEGKPDRWKDKYKHVKEDYDALRKECGKLLDIVDIETFASDVTAKFHKEMAPLQSAYKYSQELVKHFHVKLSDPNWDQSIIGNFKDLEYKNEKYLKQINELKNNITSAEEELITITREHDKKQSQLQHKIQFYEYELNEYRKRIQDPRREEYREEPTSGCRIKSPSKRFKRKGNIPETEDPEEDWYSKYMELEKQLNEPRRDEMSLTFLKALFAAFYQSYFKLTYEYKWKHMPKILPDDVTSEFTNKLTILNALSKEMRPNDLLKVLLMYVDSELRLGIQGECVLTVFKEKTNYCNNVKQFLDECMKVTLTNVQAMIEETMQ